MNYNKILKYDYVSFDIFDTLIKRNVANPTDVFHLVEKQYNSIYPGDLLSGFYLHRREAELRARICASREDINLDEIYVQLENVYDLHTIQKLKELEIQIEIDVCTSNSSMLKLYRNCLDQKKKILIVSDMYLPNEIIVKILEKNNICEYDRLYVSSEIGLKKRTGKLFDYVLKDLQIKPEKMIHIGDSIKSDYIKPILLGINAVHIPRKVNYLRYFNEKGIPSNQLFSYKTLSAFINNNLSGNEYKKIGYETLGPLLYGFISWLLRELNENKIEKVFFLSRDGYIMKKAFDILNDTTISSHYLYASRRAWVVPTLWKTPDLQGVMGALYSVKRTTIGGLLDRIGLSPSKYEKMISEKGIDFDKTYNIKDISGNMSFINFYNAIVNDMVENSKLEFEMLLGYLDQELFNGKVAIVDIGWKGSMQNAALKIIENINKNINIHGYYIGLRPNKEDIINENMKGFLFNPGNNDELKEKEVFCNSIFETFFTANHGSVEKYKLVNGGIVPVYMKHEYVDDDGILSSEMNIINEIQDGAINFVIDFSKNEFSKYVDISPHLAAQNLFELGINPSSEDVKVFGDFRFMDYGIHHFAKPSSIFYYLIRPKKMITDYFNSMWRIGFMRRLLIVPLPYFKIYKWIRKIYLRKKE